MSWISTHRWHIAVALLGAGLIFAAFGRSIWQGYAPIDDALLIINNPLIRGVTTANIKGVFTSFDPELYIPLTFVSFQLNYLVSGLNPWFFHLTNIVLHTLNALFVFLILKKLTRDHVVSGILALLFAVHPLNSEAVVWLAGRKDLLSTFFVFLSFLFYLKYRTKGWMAYVFSCVFFLLSLLSKVSFATLPAVLIAFDLLLEKRKWSWSLITDKIPYALLSSIFLYVALFGKERVLSSATLWQTILMACKSSLFYVGKFLLPVGLHPIHTFDGTISLSSIDFWPYVLLTLALIGIAVWYIRKLPWVSFGIAWYFITLAPTFFNFQKGEVTAVAVERYAYVPMIGLLIILAIPLSMAVDYARDTKERRLTGSVIALCLFLLMTTLSFFQTKMWDDELTLFTRGLALSPTSMMARVQLAQTYRRRGDEKQAFNILKEGLSIKDHWLYHQEAGLLYAKTGDTAAVREQFETAATMAPKNPEPLFNLGSLQEQTNDVASAQINYEKAVELDSSYVVARIALGNIYITQNKISEAEEQFTQAIKWNPTSVNAMIGLAKVYIAQNKKTDAIALMQKAQTIDPSNDAVQKILDENLSNN